jgi:hypothetical protein
MEWVTVYDLREDTKRTTQIQHATANSEDYGLVPEPALFGSDEWWSAVADGRVETHTSEGVVSDVRWESMGDWPGWTFTAEDGSESRWTREGDYMRYVEGFAARITWAVVSHKPTYIKGLAGTSRIHNMLIRVDLEASDARSEREAPDPFALMETMQREAVQREGGPRSGWRPSRRTGPAE